MFLYGFIRSVFYRACFLCTFSLCRVIPAFSSLRPFVLGLVLLIARGNEVGFSLSAIPPRSEPARKTASIVWKRSTKPEAPGSSPGGGTSSATKSLGKPRVLFFFDLFKAGQRTDLTSQPLAEKLSGKAALLPPAFGSSGADALNKGTPLTTKLGT